MSARVKKMVLSTTPASKRVALARAVNDVIQGVPEFTGPVLLAKNYFKNNGEPSIASPKGWWQSEKFDGYRAVWTGSKFVSRTGNVFVAPQWFKDAMPPKIPLDGELWIGRKAFAKCGSIRHKVPVDADWVHVRYLVFDMPTVARPFEVRMDLIEVLVRALVQSSRAVLSKYPEVLKLVPKNWTPLVAVKHKQASSEKQVRKDLDAILAKGGEGLMLRQPGSAYEGKRSGTLLKVKKAFDTECRVLGYKLGSGKYAGKLGAFHCQLVSDPSVKFHLSGMTDAVRNNYKTTHPVGTVLTFTYNETSKTGVPRFPRYQRIRTKE